MLSSTSGTTSSENTVIKATDSHTTIPTVLSSTYSASSDLITTTDTPIPMTTSEIKIDIPTTQAIHSEVH